MTYLILGNCMGCLSFERARQSVGGHAPLIDSKRRDSIQPIASVAPCPKNSTIGLQPALAMHYFRRLLTTLGQAPWSPGGPDGFPDTAAAWMSPSGMRGRLDVASFIARRTEATADPQILLGQILGEACSRETRSAVAAADSRAQGLAILFASPEFQRR